MPKTEKNPSNRYSPAEHPTKTSKTAAIRRRDQEDRVERRWQQPGSDPCSRISPPHYQDENERSLWRFLLPLRFLNLDSLEPACAGNPIREGSAALVPQMSPYSCIPQMSRCSCRSEISMSAWTDDQ